MVNLRRLHRSDMRATEETQRDHLVRDADLGERAGRRDAAAQRLVQDRGGDGLGVAREELGDGPRDVGAVLQQGLCGAAAERAWPLCATLATAQAWRTSGERKMGCED